MALVICEDGGAKSSDDLDDYITAWRAYTDEVTAPKYGSSSSTGPGVMLIRFLLFLLSLLLWFASESR